MKAKRGKGKVVFTCPFRSLLPKDCDARKEGYSAKCYRGYDRPDDFDLKTDADCRECVMEMNNESAFKRAKAETKADGDATEKEKKSPAELRKEAYAQYERAYDMAHKFLMEQISAEHDAMNRYATCAHTMPRKEINKRRDAVIAENAKTIDHRLVWLAAVQAKRLYEIDWKRVIELAKKSATVYDKELISKVEYLVFTMSNPIGVNRCKVVRGKPRYDNGDMLRV